MSESVILEEVRLQQFKSFLGASLRLSPLTLLVGRNGSGKSNVLDAIEALSRLARGDDLRDALSEIRGGFTGCAPFGADQFSLGCTVAQGETRFGLDVTIRTKPEPQIISERLWVADSTKAEGRTLLNTDSAPIGGLSDIVARYDSGKRGPNPPATFSSNRLLIAQVASRVPVQDTGLNAKQALELVHAGSAAVLAGLRAVFLLDPVPHLMRRYVAKQDSQLRRDASNLSAVVGKLQEDSETKSRLLQFATMLPQQTIERIDVDESNLGEAMIAMRERTGRTKAIVSARLMSDGMLRFLALSAALLEEPTSFDGVRGQRVLVVEEIENGLHPAQAGRIVELLREEVATRGFKIVATTHNPALLSALAPADHQGVVICDRDEETGASRLRRLVDLDAYPAAMAQGELGDAVIQGTLFAEADTEARERALSALLAKI